MATNFEAALLRLKAALQVQTDKEVAAALGMSATALNDRKKRESFPEDRVRALATRLNFDVDYVLTGVAQAALELIEAAREGRPLKKVSPEDQALLMHWHSCEATDQAMLLALVKRLAESGRNTSLMPDGRYPKTEDETPRGVHEKRKNTL